MFNSVTKFACHSICFTYFLHLLEWVCKKCYWISSSLYFKCKYSRLKEKTGCFVNKIRAWLSATAFYISIKPIFLIIQLRRALQWSWNLHILSCCRIYDCKHSMGFGLHHIELPQNYDISKSLRIVSFLLIFSPFSKCYILESISHSTVIEHNKIHCLFL